MKPKLNYVKSYGKCWGHLLLMYRLRRTVCWFMYLKSFGILASRCGCVVVTEGEIRDERSEFDPALRFSFSLLEILSIAGLKFSKCLKMAATVYERHNCPGGA